MNNLKNTLFIALITVFVMTAISCGPPKLERIVEVAPNETAFVIPLEGDTKDKQMKFESVQYLEERKVAAKRISLPLRRIKTGRMWWQYEWIPTVRVVKVDRSPVTVELTGNGRFKVETAESIDFHVGAAYTAAIKEQDTAKFLYNYPSKSLRDLMGQNIRNYFAGQVSGEFGEHPLETARGMKGKVTKIATKAAESYFKEYGITIHHFALMGGLDFTDPKIQAAINRDFESAMLIGVKENETQAQANINKKMVEQAKAERVQAEEFAKAAEARQKQIALEVSLKNAEAKIMRAQAAKIFAERWNGALPEKMMPSDSSFLMNMD